MSAGPSLARPGADEAALPHLLSSIDALREEIAERVESIEDGTYWDDYDEWDDSGYHDEEPDALSEEQADDLGTLFGEAGVLFLAGQFGAARQVYEKLFSLLSELGENCPVSPIADGACDIKESRARYCRSVYETTGEERRVDEVAKALEVDAVIDPPRFDPMSRTLPLMQDVIDARAGDLEGWQSFLDQWRVMLSRRHADRAQILLLEVTTWLDGIDGVAKLARGWGAAQPRGYVYWLQRLSAGEDWERVLDVGEEALRVLPSSRFRVQVADSVVEAAENLGRSDGALLGRRERFLSSGEQSDLLDLLGTAAPSGCRDRELGIALDYLQSHKDSIYGAGKLYVKTLLMAGKLKQAWEATKDERSIGWSSGSVGVVFGSVLYVLAGRDERAASVAATLRRYADDRYEPWARFGQHLREDDPQPGALAEITVGLGQVLLSETDRTTFLAWARKIGCERIDSIVSNQHRDAYRRAAEVLGALAECHALLDDSGKAAGFFREFCEMKFNRHSAFRREVQSVISASAVLTQLRVRG